MAQTFDTLVLDFQLFNFATDKFVLAIVRADGVEIDWSPMPVPHVANGKHIKIDPGVIFFPENTQHLSIDYEVFDDAAYTIRSIQHSPGSEHYVLDNPIVGGDPILIEKINQLIDIVTRHDNNSQLFGLVGDEVEIIGQTIEDNIFGLINGDVELVGFVTDNDSIDDTVDDKDTIEGVLP
jgi:hypothetical protein